MIRLVFLLVFAFLVYSALRYALRKKKLSTNQFFSIYFATLVGIALLFLGATGRLHPLFAVVGAVLPFMSRLISMVMHGAQMAAFVKFLKGAGLGSGQRASGGHAPDRSEIHSHYIHMTLDHDTGVMDGEILAGSLQGHRLSALPESSLTTLLDEIQGDADSVNLLVAYLDRHYPGWQDATPGGDAGRRDSRGGDAMTEREALDILGLDDDASAEDIVQAHRRMMQKMHPDRGGSTYLATKINAAKDFLMEKRR